MAEKIEMFAGWDWDASVIVGRERNQHLPNRCTVVVHDDKAERVFTESEVRELIETLCAIPNFIPHKPLAETLKQTMREVSSRYLD